MIIRNGRIHDAVNPEAFRADIRVENGKIAAIGPELPDDGGEVFDAEGLEVWPGFIDAHTHMGMFGFSGNDSKDDDELTKAIRPQNRGIDGVNPREPSFARARLAGVTSVCVGPGSVECIGGTHMAIKTAGDRIDDMVIKDPCAMKIAFGENPKGRSTDKKTTRMTVASEIREALMKAREYMVKKEAAKGDVFKTPAYNADWEALIPVLQKKIPLKAHAHRADDIFTAIRIAKEFDVRLTLEHVTDGFLFADILAGEGYPICAGPYMSQPKKDENRNSHPSHIASLIKAGCHVCTMTDSPVVAEEFLPVCAALLMREGVSEFEALKTITAHAAEHLGIQDRVGTLVPGKDADIVITPPSGFSFATKPAAVFINGQRVTDTI